MEKTIKKYCSDPVFFLFFFSFVLGSELGTLSKNLESFGSIFVGAPLLTIENLMWLYFSGLFFYFSFKEKSKILKTTYSLAAGSFLFTEAVIHKIGFKSLYAIKIVFLFSATMLLLNYLIKFKNLDN